MDITIVGFIAVIISIIGVGYKLYSMMRGIEIQLFNHFTTQMNRIEDRLGHIEDKVYELKIKK